MTDMTWEEAVSVNEQINGKAAELARLLIEMRDRKGWKALGFKSWTAYLSSDMLKFSRQYLTEMVRAQPVAERLQVEGITVNHSVANVLASFSPETQVIAAKTALKRHGKLTESNVRRTAEVIEQAEKTGHVESNPGTTNALEAALDTADEEAAARQNVYRGLSYIKYDARISSLGLGSVTLLIDDPDVMDALRKALIARQSAHISIPKILPPETIDAARLFGSGINRHVDTRLVTREEATA